MPLKPKRVSMREADDPASPTRKPVAGASFSMAGSSSTERKLQALAETDRRNADFLAGLSHQLRNSLAPICNAVEIIRQAEGNQEVAQAAFEIIERQIAQMTQLADDLLDVRWMSQGKIQLRQQRIELASVIRQAVEAASPGLETKDLNLTLVLPPQPVYLSADPVRLAQVISHLLSNARKFTNRGGNIWLTAEVVASGETRAKPQVVRHEAKGSSDDDSKLSGTPGSEDSGSADQKLFTPQPSFVTIRVRDTGIGIAANQLPHIFEMFLQVDTSRERGRSGLGLGLTLAKNLVEGHGGTLKAYSAGLDQGTEFVVRLPMASLLGNPGNVG